MNWFISKQHVVFCKPFPSRFTLLSRLERHSLAYSKHSPHFSLSSSTLLQRNCLSLLRADVGRSCSVKVPVFSTSLARELPWVQIVVIGMWLIIVTGPVGAFIAVDIKVGVDRSIFAELGVSGTVSDGIGVWLWSDAAAPVFPVYVSIIVYLKTKDGYQA